MTTMAIDNKDKKVLKSSIEREQNEVACSAECEKIKGSKNLNVPHLRFPEFSGEWDSFKLVELGKFIGGGTPSSSNLSFWTGSIPWISSSDIKEDNINNISISRYITEDAIEKSATKYCPAPVILIVSRVGVGKVALSHTSLCTSQDFCNIIDIKCHPVFLSYNLLRTMKRKSREVQGTSIKGITSDELQKIRVFIPKNKDEQNKISNLLTLLDERIVTQNKIIEDLKKLKSAIIERHYNQAEKQTVFIADLGEPFNVGNLSKDDLSETGKPCIIYGELFTTYGETISQVESHTNKKEGMTLSKKGDLLFPTSTTVDAISLIAPSFINIDGVILGGDMFGIHINPNYNAQYLSYYFNHIANRQLAKYAKGSTIIHLHYTDIENAKLLLPSLEEQNRMAKCLVSLDAKINIENIFISLLKSQKIYFLYQMFI
jgi:type I restriction enzyme S subunit